MVQRKFTEEHKRKISESKKGKPSHRKGKTMDEEYGIEKAKEIKSKISFQTKTAMATKILMPYTKGKTYDELYGVEKAKEIKSKISPKGRTHSYATRLKMSNSRLILNQNKASDPCFKKYGICWKSVRKELKSDSVCSNCLSRENLEVHHKDRNRLNNSKENLEVLCMTCHRKEHYPKGSLFGKNKDN